MNFDVCCSSKPGVVSYLRMISDLNLQLFDELTRPGTFGPGTDHIITDTAGLQRCASVMPAHVSDHDMVTLDALYRELGDRRARPPSGRSVTSTMTGCDWTS